MTSFEVLKYLHISCAILWLGGAAGIVVLGMRLVRVGTAVEVASVARQVEWFGMRYFTPLSLLVLLFGVGMVAESDGIDFGQLWVILGLAGILSTITIGVGFLTPRGKRIAAAIEEHGPEHPSIRPMVGNLLAMARIDTVILFLIVLDMVAKPGL